LLFVIGPKMKLQKENIKQEKLDVKQYIITQIRMLRATYLSADGWRDIVDDTDVGNLCSQFDVFIICLKVKYLAVTLTYALSHYEHTVNFWDICTAAIYKIVDIDFNGCGDEDCDQTGVIRIHSPQTVMKWLREF
jgi:hypothetical protein